MSIVIARLKGGLGNQLFIYAAGLALSKQVHSSLIIDSRSGFWNDRYKRQYELNNFGITGRQMPLHCSFLIKILIRFSFFQKISKDWYLIVNEQNFDFTASSTSSVNYKILILDGYFQSENYFKNVRENLRSMINSSLPLPPEFKEFEKLIASNESVCVHGRLLRAYASDGTKVSDSDPKVLKASYFIEGIDLIRKKVSKPHFFIFSDSPQEFVKILPLQNDEFTLIHHKLHYQPQIDFELMRRCKHFIIPNSSYSWWAAWLAEASSTNIIAPNIEYWDDENVLPKRWFEIKGLRKI